MNEELQVGLGLKIDKFQEGLKSASRSVDSFGMKMMSPINAVRGFAAALSGLPSAAAPIPVAAGFMVVVFIAFFLMASGDSFRRKMVKIAGPTFAQKRITVQVLDEITGQIHRYLLVQVTASNGEGETDALTGTSHATMR